MELKKLLAKKKDFLLGKSEHWLLDRLLTGVEVGRLETTMM